jgi:hypothetical protein
MPLPPLFAAPVPPPAPIGAPPFPEEVPVAVELVAEVGELEGTALELLVVVVELVDGELLVVEVVLVEVEVVLVLEVHWLRARTLTVLAACCRFCVSWAFTPPRLLALEARLSAALEALLHWPLFTASFTWLSWALRLEA